MKNHFVTRVQRLTKGWSLHGPPGGHHESPWYCGWHGSALLRSRLWRLNGSSAVEKTKDSAEIKVVVRTHTSRDKACRLLMAEF